MPKVVRKKESYTRTMAENDQQELFRIKQMMKELQKREEEIKARLALWMERNLEPDRSGHYLFTVIGSDGNPVYLQRQARKKISLKQEEAVEFLREHGFLDAIKYKEEIAPEVTTDQIIEVLEKAGYNDFIVRKDVVDDFALSQLVASGEISMEDFEKLCNIEVSYAMTFLTEKQIQEALEKEQEETNHAAESDREEVSSWRERNRSVPHRKARR